LANSFSRISSHSRSAGFNSGEYAGSLTSAIFSGTRKSFSRRFAWQLHPPSLRIFFKVFLCLRVSFAVARIRRNFTPAVSCQHSVVESAIHALGNHGLDRCPDLGLVGFKRYVALAVVARNLPIIGHILQQKEARLRRQKNIEQKAA